jgi:hypothetical protein
MMNDEFRGDRRAAPTSHAFILHHSSFAIRSALLALLMLSGCDAKLPEPESPGAQLYAARCSSGCHRLYAPSLMKFPMWKNWVHRMQGEFARRGLPPLAPDEEALLLAYLERHSGH